LNHTADQLDACVKWSFNYPVVFEMVALEGDGERQADRQVCEDAEKAIGHRTLDAEACAVGNLVDACNNKKGFLEVLGMMYALRYSGRRR
jgi:hypothetical protein